MTISPVCLRLWQHPIVKGIAAVSVFVIVAGFLCTLIPPAWAAVAIPITDKITVDLGDIPPWIIAFVALGGLWKAWKAEERARDAATLAATAVAEIRDVKKQTDGVMTMVASMAKAEGKAEEKKEVAAAKEIIRTDVVLDGEAAAKVKSAEGGDPPKPDGKV